MPECFSPWGRFEHTDQNIDALDHWYKLMESFGDDPLLHCQADRVLKLLGGHVDVDPELPSRCTRKEKQVTSQLADFSKGSVGYVIRESYLPWSAPNDRDWKLLTEKLTRLRDAKLTAAQWDLLAGALGARPSVPMFVNTQGAIRRRICGVAFSK